ncbi:MAG TPA: methyltransferase domain-containing protein [Opitutaceae bacterium]|jgi:malonyl-CoA O-methyltransferase|nr:methyltransferase domain-containing protein [Opitutaceae bacterium]
MKIGWLMGWAVSEAWFAPLARQALPEAEHVFVAVEPDALAQLEKAGPFDWVVGYSLGSLLLLREAARVDRIGRVALLAPIFAFLREAELGGRVAQTQVRQLSRWLRRDEHAALADFYARAGLDVPQEHMPSAATDILLWGLERLENDRAEPPLPAGWRAWCGANDALLDAARLGELASSVQIVAGATHHPAALLRAFAEEVERVDPNALMNSDKKSVLGSTRSTSSPHALAASFGRAAPNYHEHARVQVALADWLAEWLPAKHDGRALEIGAGPGIFTRKLLPWAGALTATDISPAMGAAGRAALPQVDWRVMSAEAPEPGLWDWIFCSSMLQWVTDPEKVFAGWRERLAPGGRLLAGLFVEGSLPEWRAVAGEDSPLAWRPAEEWCACLDRAGLRVVRSEVQSRVFKFPSARAFLRSVHGVGGAPQRRLPLGRLRRLLHDYETRFQAPGGVPATWIFFRVEAVRKN